MRQTRPSIRVAVNAGHILLATLSDHRPACDLEPLGAMHGGQPCFMACLDDVLEFSISAAEGEGLCRRRHVIR
ncbi:hypothetical protein [Salinicola acroporae]|uniref:Uncharacterized protein n=1 Tax=Salinicola acroporae TaxID=1541440 RepID=A0ABT6I6S6_9GAMM|nr:hypothetical protein [Salinicola acroporae]MDH4573371.1 hypothetical protein [Salinicola acroporae]